MNFRICIKTKIPNNGYAVIQIRCLTNCGENSAAGHYPREDQTVDIEATKHALQVGSRKGRNTSLGDYDVTLKGCNLW